MTSALNSFPLLYIYPAYLLSLSECLQLRVFHVQCQRNIEGNRLGRHLDLPRTVCTCPCMTIARIVCFHLYLGDLGHWPLRYVCLEHIQG
jgi:hypothetical protein